MSYRFSDKTNSKFDIKGLSHVAIVVKNMKRTVDFYENVLGFRLVKTCNLHGGQGQHFFFDMGDGMSSLAFFWFPEAPDAIPGGTVRKAPSGVRLASGEMRVSVTAVGSMNHIAFNVDADKLPEYKRRLEAAGIKVAPIMHHVDNEEGFGTEGDPTGWLSSIYFQDPDGIQLEFAAWRRPMDENDAADPAAEVDSRDPARAREPA